MQKSENVTNRPISKKEKKRKKKERQRLLASQFERKKVFLGSGITSCSFQGTFSLIIEAWNAESPKEHHDYTGEWPCFRDSVAI